MCYFSIYCFRLIERLDIISGTHSELLGRVVRLLSLVQGVYISRCCDTKTINP